MRCNVPGCSVSETGGRETCVVWGGRRLCYPHFVAWAVWTQTPVDRAPIDTEWQAFTAHASKLREAG